MFENKVDIQAKDIVEIRRKGDKSITPRRIIMKFVKYEKKIEVLKLKDLFIGEVRINIVHDRTINQQIQHKKLVAELKERRLNGETDIFIKNERIVQYRQPFRPTPQSFWG